MIYDMQTLDACMNDLTSLVNNKCVILTHIIPLHIENEWSYDMIHVYQQYSI